ncbi:MAG: YdeI/OmpD-associated family protein [Bacteriovoracaceae bacterium]|nr:YdeI/OmpD-associated family protein [Bacteroidota bacterium]
MIGKKSASGSYRFSAVLERSDNKLWGCHFRVPKTTAAVLKNGNSRRVICTLNSSERYQCAILHYATDLPVISVNKKVRDTLGVTFGMKVEVELQQDTSAYGLPLPAELKEVFRQDPEGKKLFHALTPGKQRTLIYIVGNVNDLNKKIFRSLAILRHLKETKGKIDYKKLGVALKDQFAVKQQPERFQLSRNKKGKFLS